MEMMDDGSKDNGGKSGGGGKKIMTTPPPEEETTTVEPPAVTLAKQKKARWAKWSKSRKWSNRKNNCCRYQSPPSMFQQQMMSMDMGFDMNDPTANDPNAVDPNAIDPSMMDMVDPSMPIDDPTMMMDPMAISDPALPPMP